MPTSPSPQEALERLAALLGPSDYITALTTGHGRLPHLTVASRHAPLTGDIYAQDEWYWWSWGSGSPRSPRRLPARSRPCCARPADEWPAGRNPHWFVMWGVSSRRYWAFGRFRGLRPD